MTAHDDIAAARTAWARLRRAAKATWADWLAIGKALQIGRAECLRAAQTNKPVGTRYNRLMGEWLRANDLHEINGQERYSLALVMDNLPAIETWRATLSAAEQRRLNHPNPVLRGWRRSQRPAPITSAEKPPVSVAPETGGATRGVKNLGRPIFWPGDCIGRAADAIAESRSADCCVLARVALEAAIRGENDLRALLGAAEEKGRQVATLRGGQPNLAAAAAAAA